MRRLQRTLAIVLAVSFLAACSGGQGGPAATATPEGGFRRLEFTLPPCQRAELEAWLPRSGSLVFEYAQAVNNNLATPPDQMAGVLEQLGILHSAIQGITPPPCAVDHHAMIENMMTRAIDALTAYAEGRGLDLAAFATESNAAMDRIRVREEELAAQYTSLPRE